ncbi:putative phage tail protein [Pseudomonas grimontii]|uniref:putative phage tail protein n=1 Tax=Pseudomonas grimontii TaxID=129847 RepID=UPI00387ACFA6
MSEDDYKQQLQQLLPPGPAFDVELQTDIAALVAAFAPEFARIDAALDELQAELNPASVSQLLTDWEQYLGIPDVCVVPGSQTVAERRQAVLNKMSATGAPQRAYYLRMATQTGIGIAIDEFRPARVGSTNVGDFLYGDAWPWSWLASAQIDAYGTSEAATLDCRLQLEAPEYTEVVLGFGQEVVDNIFNQADSLFNVIHYVTPAATAGIEDF